MLLKRLIIVGHPDGHLATAIRKAAKSAQHVTNLEIMSYNDNGLNPSGMDNLDQTMVIYTGKTNRLLAATYLMCTAYKLPLIMASTGLEEPNNPQFPFIKAPNLALPILATFNGLPAFWDAFGPIHNRMEVRVVEDHQKSKNSVPGTAKRFAEIFGYVLKPEDSIRDKDPRHAYHTITISGMKVKITLMTEIDGLDPYGEGALWICEKFLERNRLLGMSPGHYLAENLLK